MSPCWQEPIEVRPTDLESIVDLADARRVRGDELGDEALGPRRHAAGQRRHRPGYRDLDVTRIQTAASAASWSIPLEARNP